MINQKLPLSIPLEWRERFLIKRIGEDDIEITLEERNEILKALNGGARFIQIGKYTLMINAIKSIDPLWGDANIPPRPKIKQENIGINKEGRMMFREVKSTREKAELWDTFFKDKLL